MYERKLPMDTITKKQRSKIMSSIKAKSHLEDIVTKELWHKGIRFRRNVKSLKGTPDIAIKKYQIVIFIDSCFWHCCPEHFRMPKSNLEYWEKKFNRNKEHDEEVTAFYLEQDWMIIRIWEHEIKQDFDGVVNKIAEAINEAKAKG